LVRELENGPEGHIINNNRYTRFYH
jgi:hypothetical protein